ncbi:MAG: hypothetical protein RL208_483 [Pseudomonadota bacterium]
MERENENSLRKLEFIKIEKPNTLEDEIEPDEMEADEMEDINFKVSENTEVNRFDIKNYKKWSQYTGKNTVTDEERLGINGDPVFEGYFINGFLHSDVKTEKEFEERKKVIDILNKYNANTLYNSIQQIQEQNPINDNTIKVKVFQSLADAKDEKHTGIAIIANKCEKNNYIQYKGQMENGEFKGYVEDYQYVSHNKECEICDKQIYGENDIPHYYVKCALNKPCRLGWKTSYSSKPDKPYEQYKYYFVYQEDILSYNILCKYRSKYGVGYKISQEIDPKKTIERYYLNGNSIPSKVKLEEELAKSNEELAKFEEELAKSNEEKLEETLKTLLGTPFNKLDPNTKNKYLEIIKEQERSNCLYLSSHDNYQYFPTNHGGKNGELYSDNDKAYYPLECVFFRNYNNLLKHVNFENSLKQVNFDESKKTLFIDLPCFSKKYKKQLEELIKNILSENIDYEKFKKKYSKLFKKNTQYINIDKELFNKVKQDIKRYEKVCCQFTNNVVWGKSFVLSHKGDREPNNVNKLMDSEIAKLPNLWKYNPKTGCFDSILRGNGKWEKHQPKPPKPSWSDRLMKWIRGDKATKTLNSIKKHNNLPKK